MIPSKIEDIIVKFLTNAATLNELEVLHEWIENDNNAKVFKTYIETHFAIAIAMNQPDLKKVKQDFLKDIKKEKRKQQLQKITSVVKYAAVVIFIVGASFLAKNQFFPESIKESISSREEQITLQLANGELKSIKNGAKEIILLGQNVNAYLFQKNNKKYKLSSLIRELNNIKNLKRIRFTTSHPKDVTEDLINCYKKSKKLMPILHLPIQSGSDKILKLMNRKHDREYYLSVIKKLKNINKDIKISSDFIVGYPGETEKDFEDTIDLINEVGFVNSYSFIFSPRPGTPAASKKLNNLFQNKTRLKKLQNTLENFQVLNNQIYLHKFCEVLVENKLDGQEKYFGRTKFMNSVKFKSDNCKPGELINVKITSFNKNSLFGFHMKNKVQAA